MLSEIAAETGETVAIGALLGQLDAGAPLRAGCQRPAPRRPSDGRCRRRGRRRADAMPPAPSAAKIAAENGVDLAAVAGSGKRGQVLKGDVLATRSARRRRPPRRALALCRRPCVGRRAPARASPPDDAAREERVRMTKLRQTIARRLKDAQNTAAMLTTFNEVDMSEVMALRARYKDAFEKKHGVKLGFMGFFVKACVQALKEIPAVNAEIDGADLVYQELLPHSASRSAPTRG